jgi:chemotaxis protein MotB
MIRRRSFDEDQENHDRWLISYADFITLLFAFFVVMYGVSSVNQKKYEQLSSAIGTAFSGTNLKPTTAALTANAGDKILPGQNKSFIKPLPLSHLYQEKIKREHENMTRMGIQLSNKLATFIKDEKISVLQDNHGVRINIKDSLLFDPGSDELSDSAQKLLVDIAAELKDNPHAIQVEGHTDNIPIHSNQFFSNWELSALRATTVVRTMHAAGIDESRLSALGFAASRPISDNNTATGRAQNRRVSLLIPYDNPAQDTPALEIKPQDSPTVPTPLSTYNP